MSKKDNNNSGENGNGNGNTSAPAPAPAPGSGEVEIEVIPEEFKKVICDFINDFGLTFPEYYEKLDKYSSVDGAGRRILSCDNITELYQHCKKIYPVRFFDILYKNVEIFTNRGADAVGSKIDVHFLPDVDFANVWNTPDISDKTRETIMKYLQLILF